MLNSYYRLSIPDDLAAYYNVTTPLHDKTEKFDSDLIINRDIKGCITSVKYLTPEKEVLKEVFYKGESICKINHYRGKTLYSTEGYKDGMPVLKFVFKSSGHLAYSIEYEYKNGRLVSIRKKRDGKDILVEYTYANTGNIYNRNIFLNDKLVLEQQYICDSLDRVVEYKDNNQKITVNQISKKNELISYEITDKMGNEIKIENHFTDLGYVYTNITINGHSSQVKDTSYVDNVMLKKPYASENDLDLIIANLFRGEDSISTANEVKSKSEQEIEYRTLPLSMRKRLLYSMASKV